MIEAFIRLAIDRRMSVWIDYIDAKGFRSRRHIFPERIELNPRNGRRRVIGECEVLYEERSFFIDMIRQVAFANSHNTECLERYQYWESLVREAQGVHEQLREMAGAPSKATAAYV